MGEQETQARIRRDVEVGDLSMAHQRLRGLINSYPQRLDLREQLGLLSRREGRLSEAGRWLFVSGTSTDDEHEAFLARFPDPAYRMKAVAWRGDEDAAGPEGARRLTAVRLAAEEGTGRPLTWNDPMPPRRTPSLWDFLVMCAILAAALLVLGVLLGLLVEGVRMLFGASSG